MKVSEIKPNQSVDTLELEITSLNDTKEFDGPNGSGRVQDGVGKDKTGSVKFTLWHDDCDTVKLGDKIVFKEGWAKTYQDELQVSTGKGGKFSKA